LFFNSRDIFFNRNSVYNDRHETVINTAQFTTLAVVNTGTINVKAYLI
jgi:hypothetical protein